MYSDIAFGFWIKPFLILQIKCWCCAESRFSHKNTNNSRLMMQLREKINLELAVIKCFFLNPPACWVQAVLATSQGCLRCQRGCPTLLSICTFCSWHICVCGASWPWNSHQREKNKKKKKISSQELPPSIYSSYYQNIFPLFSLHRNDIQ